MLGQWSRWKECQPLLKMIDAGSLKSIGIDLPQYGYTIGNHGISYVDILQQAVKKVDSPGIFKINWTRLKELYAKSFNRFNDSLPVSDIPQKAELVEMMELFNQIDKYALLLSKEYGKDTEIIRRSISNNKVYFRHLPYILRPDFTANTEGLIIGNNYRDRQMADNLIWYLDQNPDKKIIVWCANTHGSRDISEIISTTDSLMYFQMQLLGEYLAQKYGDELYTVAFTSSSPVYAYRPIGKLEQELEKSKSNYGFIDFTALRYHPDYFGKYFNSNIDRTKGDAAPAQSSP